jgi:2-methylisocitrate lyase-like PEP mutase family enzyme
MTQPSWRELVSQSEPLVLPIAHDALTARLIQRAGFKAYSVGGFALVGARYGVPDVGLVGLAEMAHGVRDIMAACDLPIMVDGDDGYGDVKNVSRTIHTYEQMGVSAIFIEDQVAPKRCGHMAGKDVVPSEVMEAKLRAASAARDSKDFFLVARTDARAVHGLDDALRRAERYLKAGADGLFVEAPQSIEELRMVGERFRGVPQIANMVEDGKTPLLPVDELYALGFSMVVYPCSVIFRVAQTIEKALADIKSGELKLAGQGLGFDAFKERVGYGKWSRLEDESGPKIDGRSNSKV